MILNKNKLIKQKDFKNEKELQDYFEENIEMILGLKYVVHQFTVGDFRVDTLAFDVNNKSFNIIEYKNIKNGSLIDQGYTYLNLLLERKADFVLKVNEVLNKNFSIKDIDWSLSRITFVAPSFTEYQLNATNFINLPFELYKVIRYENDIISIEKIIKTSKTNIKSLKTSPSNEKVESEVVVYNEDYHFKNISQNTIDIYNELKNRVLEIDDIDIEIFKSYIAYKGITNIFDVQFTKNNLKIDINLKKGTLKDPLGLARDISNIGHNGNGDYEVKVANSDDIDNVIPLLKQSIEKNKK